VVSVAGVRVVEFGTRAVAIWFSGNVVWHINEVALRRARLVLRWVTVRGYTVLVFNQAAQANSAWPVAIPPWVGTIVVSTFISK